VFFHTNGYGDAVFFDGLGWPWRIHGCYEARLHSRTEAEYRDYRAYMVGLYGQPPAEKKRHAFVPPQVRTPKSTPSATRKSVERDDIVRCDPSLFLQKNVQAVGYIQDLHEKRSVSKLAQPGTIAHGLVVKALGAAVFSQLTVIDGNMVSYTMLVPKAELNVQPGAIVAADLERIAVPSIDPFYVCRGLSVVKLDTGRVRPPT